MELYYHLACSAGTAREALQGDSPSLLFNLIFVVMSIKSEKSIKDHVLYKSVADDYLTDFYNELANHLSRYIFSRFSHMSDKQRAYANHMNVYLRLSQIYFNKLVGTFKTKD